MRFGVDWVLHTLSSACYVVTFSRLLKFHECDSIVGSFVISEFGANVIKLAISLDSISKEHVKVMLLDCDPLSSKILLSVNSAATQAAG